MPNMKALTIAFENITSKVKVFVKNAKVCYISKVIKQIALATSIYMSNIKALGLMVQLKLKPCVSSK